MAKAGRFKIALVQMSLSPMPDLNLERAAGMVEEAARAGAQVVCLPELFRSQYFCQVEDASCFDLSETIPGDSTRVLGRVAADYGIVVIAPVFEKRAPGLYHNTAVVIDADGEIASIYRKMHIPDDPGYFEKYYFSPGDLGFKAVKSRYGNIGVLICWDQWFPEAARVTALNGAEVLFYPTAIGWHPQEKETYGAAQLDAWRTVQRAHAIANGVYVASVNRVGFERGTKGEGGIEFWGRSFACDPQGVIIAEAGGDEEIIYAEVDRSKIEEIRRNWPFLRDRRIDAYGGILNLFLDD